MPWQDDLAPILGAVGGLRGRGGNAFMQRWQELEAQKAQQEQLKQQSARQATQDDMAQQRLMLDAESGRRAGEQQTATINRQFIDSISGLINDESLIDPAEFERRRALVLNTAPPTIERGFLEQTLRVEPTVFQQRAAKKKLEELKKLYSPAQLAMFEADDETGAAPVFPVGSEQLTIAQMRERVGAQATVNGKPMSMRQTPKQDVPNTPEEQFYQRFAQENGAKSFSELPTAKQAAARKQWMQSDDRPQPQATVLIQTVDASGNPVQRFVAKQPGEQFAIAPTASQQTALAEQEASIAQIDEIDRLFRPEYVGPVVGRTTRVQMQMPGAPDVERPVAEFYAAVAGLRNEIIRLMSGAAVSGAEESRMRAQLPDVVNKPSVFQANLAQTRRNREALLARMQARSGGTPSPASATGGRASGAGPAKPARKIGRFEVIEK